MPHLTLSVTTDGLVLPVIIGLKAQAASTLVATGQTPPRPTTLEGLIDTASNITCIPPRLVNLFGLPPVGQTTTRGVVGTHPVDLYEVSFCIPGPPSTPTNFLLVLPYLRVMEWDPPGNQEILVGMDVLSYLILWLDGPRREFMIAD
jgi:hypothetical protein